MKLFFLICLIVGVATWVGGARAQVFEGTNAGEVLTGTQYGDKMYGYGGSDTLTAKGGGDAVWGGSGQDTIDLGCGWDEAYGNGDGDLIYASCADAKADYIDCGDGRDTLFYRNVGTVVIRCEDVFKIAAQQKWWP